MNKFSFSSGMVTLTFFIAPLSARANLHSNNIAPIIDANIIKQYTQQYKQKDLEQNKLSCSKASQHSQQFIPSNKQDNQKVNQQNTQQNVTKSEEECLDNKYLFTQWGQETVIAHCEVKEHRSNFSDCFFYIKKGNDYSFYAQFIMDSRDRKAYFFRDELDITSFSEVDSAIKNRNSNTENSFNMQYSITEHGALELHIYEGNSLNQLYTQTFNQM